MSLLLEALKKAELAKQQNASQQAENETTLPLPSRNTVVDDFPRELIRDEPLDLNLTTKDQLPDPAQILDFHPDDLHTGEAGPAELDLRLDDTPPLDLSRTLPPSVAAATVAAGLSTGLSTTGGGRAGATRTAESSPRIEAKEPPRSSKPWADDSTEERAAARQVFAAKQMDYNPRRPFYITVGLLALCAIGAMGYIFWELQPKSNFSSARTTTPPSTPAPSVATAPISPPPRPAPVTSTPIASAPIASAPITPPSAVPAQVAPTPAVPAPPRTVAVPAVASAPASLAPGSSSATQAPRERLIRITPTNVTPTPRVSESAKQAAPLASTSRPTASAAAAAPRVLDGAPINIRRRAAQLDPALERAYAAFQAGDLELARQDYLHVIKSDPLNRDALLGLAAIDLRSQNYESAEARYNKILEVDPRDQHAQAGLMGLRTGIDPLQSESRLKNLIALQPESAPLNFSLGNQFAAQSRWEDAQQAYFKAHAAEPENPDFAFNLAISLDQLRQRKLALEYYQRALTLGQGRPSNFDRAQANSRIQELRR